MIKDIQEMIVKNVCGHEYFQDHNTPNNKIFYLELSYASLLFTYNIDFLTRA